MNSVRGLSPLTVCLCVQLSVCLLGVCDSSSLWGQKIQFGPVSCLWQLNSDTVVPALKELTVCVLLRLEVGSQWTGFVYKAPGGRDIELGLQGTAGDIARLQVYINGVFQFSLNESQPQELTPGGTLTLGVSHYVQSGEVKAETGTNLIGQISLFRMWAREWAAEELSKQSCADGDVLSWDTKQWSYKCTLVPDSNLQCAWPLYKINMMISVTSSRPENCSVSPEELTRDWLESILSGNNSVHDISVSSSSSACDWVNNAAAQPTQESGDPSNSSCSMCLSCEVYVNVDPATDVQAIQVNISTSLSSAFPHGFFILESDPQSISVQPVESFPAVTVPPPTISPGAATVTFFRVNVNLSMTGSPREPREIIKTWVKEKLEVNNTMIVRNVIIREAVNKYCCNFHVQEHNVKSVAEISANIDAALTPNYENGSITIEDVNVVVKHIVPENCSEDRISTVFGSYFWPETIPEVNQRRTCRSPNSKAAYRLCKLHIETDTTSWEDPDMRNCNWVVSIPGLSNVTITDGNADEVVNVIENLVDDRLNNSSELSTSELDTVVEKLFEVVHKSIIRPAIVGMIINIFADILLSKTDMTQVSNTVLDLTEQMGNNLEFQSESVSMTAPSLALSMVNVNPNEFNGLSFGVSCVNATLNPKPAAPNMGASNIHMPAADTRLALQLILQTGKLSLIFLKQSSVDEPLPDTDATISLPLALQHFLRSTERNTTRVQFQFYGTQKLFQDLLSVSATERNWTVHPFIVSASINDSHVTNLEDPVLVTFRHPAPKHSEDKIKCVFWDFQKNGGLGGWNSSGCETKIISSSCTSCFCDHLTHFAVLLDVTRDPISATDKQILAVLSYIGCGISSIFLGITLLTYIAFEKLRRDYPSKILINLSAALLGLSMLFLLNTWLSSFSNYCLCIATAATMHYFLLASFTWMGLEAVHMYLALVKVFNIYIPSYILKFCAIGWGLPLAIVSLVLAIDRDAYGSTLPEEAAVALESDDPFCWLQNAVFFYVTVAAFLFLILLCNICMFIVVLIQIRQMRINKPSANSRGSLHDLRAAAGLTVLLGLTWAVGFFSFGPGRVVFMYLFTIFNTLQGFFVFMFHCLIKENVRKQWRTHLCCGRFRLSDYSDWSRTLTLGIRRKKNNLVNSDSVGSDSSATIRKESNSSTGSAPNYHQRA